MSSRFDALASISAACWLIHLCDLRRMELGDCSGLIEPDLNVCAIDLNHFAVAITKYPTVRPWMKLNALAHHIGGPWLGFGCHRRAPAGMTVNIINTPRSIATPWARRPANRMSPRMSAIGPKQTSVVAPHLFAFGGKADNGRRQISFALRRSGLLKICAPNRIGKTRGVNSGVNEAASLPTALVSQRSGPTKAWPEQTTSTRHGSANIQQWLRT
jgi:hypothetical protein